MKVLLIIPDGHIHKIRIGPFTRSMREAPLTLTTLAALAPKELNISFKLVDECIDKIPLDEPADLVGISVLTGTAPRAYAVAKHFRSCGIPVVLGGVHVTIMPEEGLNHADSVFVGPAEKTWPQFLRDFSKGRFNRVYKDDGNAKELLINIPIPRRDLQRSRGYMVSNTTTATRGCRHGCEFCMVPVVWPRYTKRPIGDVIKDIKSMSGKLLAFNDVSLVDDVEYAKELFKAIIPLKRCWGALATIKVANDTELLELMGKSGCHYLLIGFESVSQNALKEIHKGFNRKDKYRQAMKALHGYGISVQGCFIFGFDHDDRSVFEATVQQVVDLKIDIPRYSLLTPYPGTRLYHRMVKEKRILTYNWADYDTMHVIIRPAKMSPEELYKGFKWAYKETFRIHRIAKRTLSPRFTGVINLIGNITYKRFVAKLYHGKRYSRPFSQPENYPEPLVKELHDAHLCHT